MSEGRLLGVLNESESVKESETNFDDARIENIKKDFNKLRDRLTMLLIAIILNIKVKEISKKLYRLKNTLIWLDYI